MSLENPLKVGQKRTCATDIGNGPSVGITYSTSDNSLLSVSSSGVATVIANPSMVTRVFVFATDTNGVVRSTTGIDAVPTVFDLSLYVDSDGNPLPVIVTVSEETPVSNFARRAMELESPPSADFVMLSLQNMVFGLMGDSSAADGFVVRAQFV